MKKPDWSPRQDFDAPTQAAREAQNLPPGPERIEAMKKAHGLRNAADTCNYLFSRRTQTTRLTKSNESLLFFGDNFSSVVPFYSERKSLGVVPWTSPPLFDKIISDPQSLLGDAPLGGMIDCRHPSQTSAEQIGFGTQLYTAEQTAKIDALLANRRTVFHNGRCRFMAP